MSTSSATRALNTPSHSSRLAELMVAADNPARVAASTWSRISASSGDTTSVGPSPAWRRAKAAAKYTVDFPHPVACTHSTRAPSSSAASGSA